MMADIIMESIFGKEIFSWHKSKMVKTSDVRKKYINALKEADKGNIDTLLKFAKK